MTSLPVSEIRLERARCSLEGLSVGDAFGETFFGEDKTVEERVAGRSLQSDRWHYTDDTQMALSIYLILRENGYVHQDELASSFAQRYDSSRGYGPSMHRLLKDIQSGCEWKERAGNQFGRQGSYGNGAAMRAGPIGAYYAEDLDTAANETVCSSVITHTHEEAIAGAVAVAIAAAAAWQCSKQGLLNHSDFLDRILPWVPKSEVSGKLRKARDMSEGASVQFAVSVLGNGSDLSAQDTVPFALWCAGQHLDNYSEALWLTVSGMGDRDTTCAIVGSIVSMFTGFEGIPEKWRVLREPLPDWPFESRRA
ncbi:MAG: ADP-ribosylglycohydrolase family protein [Armatimonadetes bacterium]|nr:ADP-ribosylglycohydrolase family protein [Armatimonadota bacterium]